MSYGYWIKHHRSMLTLALLAIPCRHRQTGDLEEGLRSEELAADGPDLVSSYLPNNISISPRRLQLAYTETCIGQSRLHRVQHILGRTQPVTANNNTFGQ